ncbi:MAG: hypothetical protein IIA45_15180 [Bacteroidetes bacterium]|nr:hypothetical protein [Bacteroidota bacterium]
MKFFKSLFLTDRFFLTGILLIIAFVVSNFEEWLFQPVLLATLLFIVLSLFEIILVFGVKNGVRGRRDVAERLSNGDENVKRTVSYSCGRRVSF